MKNNKNFFISALKFFTPYEWFLLITIITLNIIVAVVTGEVKPLSIIAAVSGVLCVVLVAKKHISNYIFGLIQVSLYAYLSWGVGYWGEVALNALYYVPMQFIGFALWRKRLKEGSKTEVKSRRLTDEQRVLMFVASLVIVLIGAQVLAHFDDPAPYLDSITTVLSVIAMLLMVNTYAEQWYLWIVVNVATIAMWLMAHFNGEPNALVICT
ncbi:nicotinamide riboside transporter PnuC, partial [Bacteroidales bacterium OttesenSCG-928-L14]|nr:nicotinamide riboside transporter PnuC [Bacteroidales bacterium OttesenSCG-928-L14]